MTDSTEPWHRIGAFEPADAKRLLAALEAAGIPFEIEADHTALNQPGRWVPLALGLPTQGSQVAIYVPTEHVDRALSVIERIFPV